ncbi:hypothetical protein V7266_14680 [Neobacillus drentensis]|uniref:hypothetical protein n=1 Tax=Neobacillus drentensis TaxID=220684 RepID=UPI002FFDC4C4
MALSLLLFIKRKAKTEKAAMPSLSLPSRFLSMIGGCDSLHYSEITNGACHCLHHIEMDDFLDGGLVVDDGAPLEVCNGPGQPYNFI